MKTSSKEVFSSPKVLELRHMRKYKQKQKASRLVGTEGQSDFSVKITLSFTPRGLTFYMTKSKEISSPLILAGLIYLLLRAVVLSRFVGFRLGAARPTLMALPESMSLLILSRE